MIRLRARSAAEEVHRCGVPPAARGRNRRQGPSYDLSPPTHRRVPFGTPAVGWTDERPAKPIRAQAAGVRRVRPPDSGRPRPHPDGDPMTLLRRAPREVYRVYDEDEFLEALEGEQLPDAPEPRPDIEENRQEPPDEPALMATQAVVGRRRRLAVMATLGGTGCALAVIVGASIRPAPPGVGSRPAPRQVAAGHNPAPGTLLARGARSPRTAARTRPPSPGASGAVTALLWGPVSQMPRRRSAGPRAGRRRRLPPRASLRP